MLFPNNLFVELGFEYVGPLNGHNEGELEEVFRRVKRLGRPVVVHVVSKKGGGYSYAENDPASFHGIGPFCTSDGTVEKYDALSYTEAFSNALLGLAEETGMEDVDYYLEHYPAPLFCFSPDADFPLIHGEKGILHGRLISRLPMGNIVDIRGGVAANVIPSKAEAWVKATSLTGTDKVEVQEENGLWHLTARGVGGHASLPEGTENAIGVLVRYLLDHGLADENEERFLRVLAKLNESFRGEGLGVAAPADGKFDALTIVGGVIGVEDGHMVQSLDSRYPTNTTAAFITETIQAIDPEALRVVVDSNAEPFYMETDSAPVQACLQAYREISGEDARPYTIGGGTYARHFPNAVAFGPEHPERSQPAFVGPMHGADEGANKQWLLEALQVYILALLKLEEIEF